MESSVAKTVDAGTAGRPPKALVAPAGSAAPAVRHRAAEEPTLSARFRNASSWAAVLRLSIRIAAVGHRTRKRGSTRGNTLSSAAGVHPITNSPAAPRLASRVRRTIRSASARIRCASRRKTRPASVNSTRRLVRCTRRASISSSSRRSCWLKDGCAIRSWWRRDESGARARGPQSSGAVSVPRRNHLIF